MQFIIVLRFRWVWGEFVEFKQAHDSIKSSCLWQVIVELGIPEKCLRLLMVYDVSKIPNVK